MGLLLTVLVALVGTNALGESLSGLCTFDAQLTEVAREVARTPADRLNLAELVQQSGSDAVDVRALRKAPAAVIAELKRWRSKNRRWRCGVSSGVRLTLVAAPERGRLHLTKSGSAYQVRLSLAQGFIRPSLWIMTAGSSEPLQLKTRQHDGEFWYFKAPPAIDIRQIQATADAGYGPQIVAQRTLIASTDTTYRPLVRMTTQRWNRALARAADDYARKVCARPELVHKPQAGASPVERLASHHIHARAVGEVLGRGRTESEAKLALLQSASHRAVLQDPRYTDIGGAAVHTETDYCLVMLFASWPRYKP